MTDTLHLTPGKQYRIVKEWIDFDQDVHPVGETWTFSQTNFLPYENGLTLHVFLPGETTETIYRLRWQDDAQGDIIRNFKDYVEMC